MSTEQIVVHSNDSIYFIYYLFSIAVTFTLVMTLAATKAQLPQGDYGDSQILAAHHTRSSQGNAIHCLSLLELLFCIPVGLFLLKQI